MRKSGSFASGLDGQITLTLEDKCEAKVNFDLAEIKFDLFTIRVNEYWGCLFATSEKEWRFCWWIG